jgi:hypothetical protein
MRLAHTVRKFVRFPWQRGVALAPMLGCSLLLLLCQSSGAWADTLIISNISPPGFTPKIVQLSDLIVYGTDANGVAQTMTLLKPNDASDDVFVNVGKTISIGVPLTITKYEISETVNGVEKRSVYLHLRSTVTTAMLANQADDTALVLADNENPPTSPPLPGTPITFSNGTNSNFPDWFVGTSFDPSTGIVSGGFTGTAVVDVEDLQVTIVPEPSTLALLGSGGAALVGWASRRRRAYDRLTHHGLDAAAQEINV